VNYDNELSAAAPANGRETTALRRWVTVAGIVLIMLIIGADSYEAWQDYRRVVLDNEHIQVALSRALTEQTERMVQEVDLVLADCASWIASAEGARADERALVAHLNAQIANLPFISSAAITGVDGQLRASTRNERGVARNLTLLDVFTIPQRTQGPQLFIDKPSVGGDGAASPTFALSRRINARDGAFDGVVIARVAFAYLAGFYAGVHVTPDTSIRLARDDGVTLAEFPKSDDSDAAHARAARSRALQSKERISYPVVNGHERIEVSQKVGGYPIIVEVSRSLPSVLQPWIQEERSSAARTLTLAVLAALLLMALRTALQRQEHMDHERHRLEQELAAIQRVEALGFLAASVAHDFNNVLTAIIGYAEMTREAVQAEPAVMANVDRLLAATERARLLVRRVLTFDPRRSLSYRPTRLAPILMEVAQQVQATLPPSILLSVDGADEAAAIQGDATEIYQVVMNLCSNAVHAMPTGGTLAIRLATLDIEEPRALALGQLHRGRWVSVSISDAGIGLAQEQIASIFEPFYTTRQPTHGTGIGLTVVRNIILRMNGALDVNSRLGNGTQMAVYWPSVSTPLLVPSPAGLEGGTGQIIMVVDDEKELVGLTEELLASLSYEPVGFSDARAALEAFRHDPKRFDAILTDDRMPPMRGLEFAKLIREIDPCMPVILMTGHRDPEIDRLSSAADIAEILDKPLRVQTLREALARRLRSAD
jgi:signal transduction histidine kinase/CheY-like chemotaxis protein